MQQNSGKFWEISNVQCPVNHYLFIRFSQDIVKSIIDFAGMKRDEKVIDACVLDVKRTLDRDHDGAITKEEFMVHARYIILSFGLQSALFALQAKAKKKA